MLKKGLGIFIILLLLLLLLLLLSVYRLLLFIVFMNHLKKNYLKIALVISNIMFFDTFFQEL